MRPQRTACWLGAAGGVAKQGIIVLTYTPSGGGAAFIARSNIILQAVKRASYW